MDTRFSTFLILISSAFFALWALDAYLGGKFRDQKRRKFRDRKRLGKIEMLKGTKDH